MIHSRVSWMSLPVDRSITVSAPQRVAQRSLSTSSPIDDDTAELPMFALIFTRKLRPMIIGSDSGWLMFAGMIARPRGDLVAHELGRHVLADRAEPHLLGDVAAPRVVHLAEVRRRRARLRRSIHGCRSFGSPTCGSAARGPDVS